MLGEISLFPSEGSCEEESSLEHLNFFALSPPLRKGNYHKALFFSCADGRRKIIPCKDVFCCKFLAECKAFPYICARIRNVTFLNRGTSAHTSPPSFGGFFGENFAEPETVRARLLKQRWFYPSHAQWVMNLHFFSFSFSLCQSGSLLKPQTKLLYYISFLKKGVGTEFIWEKERRVSLSNFAGMTRW